MKKNMFIVFGLILFVTSGFVIAVEESEGTADETKIEKRPEPAVRQKRTPVSASDSARNARRDRTARSGRGQAGAGRDQMYREMVNRQGEKHRAAVKELADIKTIAEEEGATKTAEAIQKLIDAKNEEFKQNIERLEKTRAERAKRIEQRMKDRAEQAGEAKKDSDGDGHDENGDD